MYSLLPKKNGKSQSSNLIIGLGASTEWKLPEGPRYYNMGLIKIGYRRGNHWILTSTNCHLIVMKILFKDIAEVSSLKKIPRL